MAEFLQEMAPIDSRTPVTTVDSQRVLIAVLAYGAVFWLCYIAYAFHLGMIGNDFGVFHRAASEPLSSVYALREANPFAYPPTTLLWLQPLAWLSLKSGFVLWVTLSIGAIAWASNRLAGPRVALLVVFSPALVTTIAVGQFGALVAAMILIAVSLKGWRQGLLLGLAATIKPQILLAAPLILLTRKDWRALIGASIAVAATITVELLALGSQLWLDWAKALRAFPKAVEHAHAYAGSVSPMGVASNFHLSTWPFFILGVTIAVLLIAKRSRGADCLELAGLIILASALMSPYLLTYDTIAIVPFVVQQMLVRGGRNQTAALAVFVSPFLALSLLWLTMTMLLRKSPHLDIYGSGTDGSNRTASTIG